MSGVVSGLGAVVLCGGQSSRMGRSKAWLPFGEDLLLQRVVRRIAEAASPIVVVAAVDQTIPDLPDDVLIARDAAPGNGPLQGILAGLTALSGLAGAAFVSSTDAPFLRPDFVRRMETLRFEGDHDCAVARAQGHLHPLAAAYRVTVRGVVEEMLARDVRRLSSLFDRVRTRFVDEADLLACAALREADPLLGSLRNINAPEDYESALREEALMSRPKGPLQGQ